MGAAPRDASSDFFTSHESIGLGSMQEAASIGCLPGFALEQNDNVGGSEAGLWD